MSATTPVADRCEAPPRHRAALAVLLLASTLTVMATAVISPVIAVLRDDLGLSGTEAGLLLTAHCLVIALASPLVGTLIDRHGVRRPMAAGLVLYGLAGGAGLFADSYLTLLSARILFGLGAALVFTGSTVGLLSLYRGAAQERVMGWRTSATATGALTWPLLGGALGTVSWHAPFGVYLLGVVVGAAALRALPDDRPEARPTAGTRLALRVVRDTLPMLGYYGLFVSSSVLLYAYGWIRGRLDHRAVLRTTYAVWTASFLLLAGTDQIVFAVAASTLFGVGMGMSLPTLTVLVGDASPPHLRGALTALSGTALSWGSSAPPCCSVRWRTGPRSAPDSSGRPGSPRPSCWRCRPVRVVDRAPCRTAISGRDLRHCRHAVAAMTMEHRPHATPLSPSEPSHGRIPHHLHRRGDHDGPAAGRLR